MGSPVCAAAEEGTKAPARSAEMAKRAPENRRIFTSTSSICDLTSPTETHHGCGEAQDKSISGPFDNITFAGACHLDHPRTTLPGHGADNRQGPRAQSP